MPEQLQPELIVGCLRSVLLAQAICMITKRIASGTAVPGWVLLAGSGLAVRDSSNEHGELRNKNDHGDDLFEIRSHSIIVKPLNMELEPVPPANVGFCFDFFLVAPFLK